MSSSFFPKGQDTCCRERGSCSRFICAGAVSSARVQRPVQYLYQPAGPPLFRQSRVGAWQLQAQPLCDALSNEKWTTNSCKANDHERQWQLVRHGQAKGPVSSRSVAAREKSVRTQPRVSRRPLADHSQATLEAGGYATQAPQCTLTRRNVQLETAGSLKDAPWV